MAIVQISRITQRKGLETDLPQPLAGAEFGWAVDQRRLFIGNGELVDGAPVVGNTEVLTEFSDILSFATEYTYKGDAAGYTVQTGATSGTPVSQSLQSRLDSFAVITDFGALGDGTTDVTADINRALYEIFCREVNAQVRRSIYFPAGIYIITDTLNIPPYCRLYGDGAESTIINFNVQNHTSTTAYTAGVLVKSGVSFYRSIAAVPVGILINNATYWAVESLPSYMLQTADSLQQTGVNIGTNGASPPGSVEISGMKFVSNQDNNGILIEAATDCFFDAVDFAGPGTTATLGTSTADSAAVRFNSTASYVCRHISFNNCKFSGMTWGVNTDEEIEGVTFNNTEFNTLYQGAYLGNIIAPAVGPNGVRISNCIFDNIYVEGVIIINCSRNITAYNTFYDVGNHFNGAALPSSSIIDIDAFNNASVGDMFERTTAYSTTYPRVNINDTNAMVMSMNQRGIVVYQQNVANNVISNTLDLGTYKRSAGIEDVITDNGSATLAVVTNTVATCFKLDYTIIRDTSRRTGTITVASGTGFSYTDDYAENATTGVTLTATDNVGTVTVAYTSTSTGQGGTIHYSITNLG